MTGTFIMAPQPLKVDIRNAVMDFYKFASFYDSSVVNWNYPEAYVSAEAYFDNLTVIQSHDNVIGIPGNVVRSEDPGNVTITNIDWDKFYGFASNLASCIGFGVDPTWDPDDGLVQNVLMENMTTSILENSDGAKTLINIFITFFPHNRITNSTAKGWKYTISQNFFPAFGLAFSWGSGGDIMNYVDCEFDSSTSANAFFFIDGYNTVNIQNAKFTNIPAAIGSAISVLNFQTLTMENIIMNQYNISAGSSVSPVQISGSSTSTVSIIGVNLEDCWFNKVPVFSSIAAISSFTLRDGVYNRINLEAEKPIFELAGVGTFEISNHNITDSQSLNEFDSSASFVMINSIDTDSLSQGIVESVAIKNSPLSFLTIGGASGAPSEMKTVYIRDISYNDWYFSTVRSLISTNGLVSDSNMTIEFSNIEFLNLEFKNGGEMIQFGHQLPNTVSVTNSSFRNIISGSLTIQPYNLNNNVLKAKAAFNGASFYNASSPSRSFISASSSAYLEFADSSFMSTESTNDASGVIIASSSSEIIFTNCQFQNNSARTSSIFLLESSSFLRWTNCTINNNFAISSGVISATSDGSYHFYDSKIYNNYAMQNPIGQVFFTNEPSIISNTEIYQNELISITTVSQEITSWSKLWFIGDTLKQTLENTNFTNFEESKPAIQVLFGVLHITSSSKISNQSEFLNSFISTVEMSNSELTDIYLDGNNIEMITSTFSMTNMKIMNITNNDNHEFIFITFDSTFNAVGIEYSNSNSVLFNILSSQATLSGLDFSHVNSNSLLLQMMDWDSIDLRNLTMYNTTISEGNFIKIDKSRGVEIKDIVIENISKIIIHIEDSNVTEVTNINITSWLESFEIISSTVTNITDSSFISNGGSSISHGGAIYLRNSDVNIYNTTFQSNKALSGGAISFKCSSLDLWNLNVQNCTFRDNIGLEQGGAIYYNYLNPTLRDNLFTNNTASYGENFASYPVKVGLVGQPHNGTITVNDVGSGIELEEDLEIALFDFDDQIMSLDITSQIIILSNDQTSHQIGGTNGVVVKNGIATFNSLSATSDPGSSNKLFSVSSRTIDLDKISTIYGNSITQPTMVMNFRYWKPGEQVLGGKWSEWSTGTYSLQWNSTTWQDCMNDAVCLNGQISVDKGFWRRTNTSTFLPQCINEEACTGGYNNSTDGSPVTWKTGYRGTLCSSWTISNGVKYQKVNDFECQKWPAPFLNAVRVFGVIFIIFAFFLLLIIINVRKYKESQLSVLLRIMTNYLQLATTSLSMSANYPNSLMDAFIPVKRLGGSSETFLSFDCFITDYEITGPFSSNAAFKLFLLGFLPIVLFGIVTLIWFVVYLVKKKLIKDMKRNLTISFISIVFLLHPKMTEQSINTFRCVQIDDNRMVSRIELEVGWYSSEHLKWWFLIAFPILVFWVISMPLAAFILIKKNIKEDENNRIKKYFLILYQGLKPNRFYWEFVNTLRKILILGVFLLPGDLTIVFAAFVLLLTARAQIQLNPYKYKENNEVEILAIAAGMVTTLSGLIYNSDDQVNSLNYLIISIVVVLNTLFVFKWIVLFLEYKKVRK